MVTSALFFQADVTPLQFLGYSVALLGMNAHKEFKKNPRIFADWLDPRKEKEKEKEKQQKKSD